MLHRFTLSEGVDSARVHIGVPGRNYVFGEADENDPDPAIHTLEFDDESEEHDRDAVAYLSAVDILNYETIEKAQTEGDRKRADRDREDENARIRQARLRSSAPGDDARTYQETAESAVGDEMDVPPADEHEAGA